MMNRSWLPSAGKCWSTWAYHVVTKNNGIDALKAFSENPNDFDVVVTDMTMPKMTGERLAQELISIRP